MPIPVWTQLFPANAPTPRTSALMRLDPSTGDVLLFGGADIGGFVFDTWKWDGTDWTELFPVNVPAPNAATLYQNCLVWDGTNGKLMLVCTESNASRFWHFDWVTPTWTELFPATVPPGFLFYNRAEWDDDDATLYMFAAGDSHVYSWDGTDWTDTGVTVAVGNADGAVFAYDENVGNIVNYGGRVVVTPNNLTYTFDAGAFTLESPADTPGDRWDEGNWAAFHRCLGGVVVYGGQSAAIGTNDGTWVYKDVGGFNWVQLSPSSQPTAFSQNVLCTDANGNVLDFGGLDIGSTLYDETWLLTCKPSFIPQIYRRR